MALTSSRNGQAGDCPVVAADGSSGSKTAHSASVRSLTKRSPSRVCCARVVAVQMAVFIHLVSTTRCNHISPWPPNPYSASIQRQPLN